MSSVSFIDTEIRKMFKEISVASILTKLRAGDIKAIALCSITVLCIGLSYLLLTGTPEEEKKVVEEEKKEDPEYKDYTIEQLVREAQ
jgi:hypothetical protein